MKKNILTIGSWSTYYNKAIQYLEQNDYRNAYVNALKCFDFVKYEFQSPKEGQQITLVEQYFKTVLLFKDCYVKKGCINCAESQLTWGLHCLNNLKDGFPCSKLVNIVINKAISDLKIETRKFYLKNQMFFRNYFYLQNENWITLKKES